MAITIFFCRRGDGALVAQPGDTDSTGLDVEGGADRMLLTHRWRSPFADTESRIVFERGGVCCVDRDGHQKVSRPERW